MNPTRIAGLAFDARHAHQIRQTARIYSYTRHIRRLAAKAAVALPGGRPHDAPALVPHVALPVHALRLAPTH